MKVADMHCDTITELYYAKRDGIPCGLEKNHLQIDIDKMLRGDYLVQNFAMFVNITKQENPFTYCKSLIEYFYQELERNKNDIAIALNYQDIIKNQSEGKLSALLTIEEGGVTEGSLEKLKEFYDLGVRMITLTWNFFNGIGYPSFTLEDGKKPDFHTRDTSRGLTDTGIAIVQEMERLGIIVDVSHLSDAGFYDVLKYTKKPFVASHSNVQGKCNHVRNLTDDMIKKIANRGGVIGMNFCPSFLQEVEDEKDAVGTIKAVVENIKHIISVGGYECVGLGSDFDGIPTHAELPDASYMPYLAEALLKEGMKQEVVEAIFYKNVLRLYKEVL